MNIKDAISEHKYDVTDKTSLAASLETLFKNECFTGKIDNATKTAWEFSKSVFATAGGKSTAVTEKMVIGQLLDSYDDNQQKSVEKQPKQEPAKVDETVEGIVNSNLSTNEKIRSLLQLGTVGKREIQRLVNVKTYQRIKNVEKKMKADGNNNK